MRILLAHSFYRIPGGEDRHVREQVELVSRAHDVRLVSEENKELSESPITAARMLYSRSKTRDIGATLDRFAPDVVHVHNAYPSLGPAVLLAAHERRIPVVMSVHNFRLRCPNGFMFTAAKNCHRCETGMYVNAVLHKCFPTKRQALAYATALWVHRFAMRLERMIARFVVPSQFLRRRMLEWGIDEGRIRVVRHFAASPRATVPAEAGTYGAYVGRLSAEKGVDLLLRALRRAGDPPFMIMGDGPRREQLESLAGVLGLVNTRFLGARPHNEVEALLAHARYVAIPSVGEEIFPLAAVEALWAGRPLLVSDRGALPELAAAGAGFVCRPEDEVDTSQKLLQLIRDDELCRNVGAAALSTARSLLAPERHLQDLEAVYREVAVERPM